MKGNLLNSTKNIYKNCKEHISQLFLQGQGRDLGVLSYLSVSTVILEVLANAIRRKASKSSTGWEKSVNGRAADVGDPREMLLDQQGTVARLWDASLTENADRSFVDQQ